jgi:hypothetical protein
MTRTSSLVVGVIGLLWTAAGCGGGSAGPLDCAWLVGDNCWKQTAAAAVPCLPPTAETGVLGADDKTCTYASGATVVFAAPLTLPVPRELEGNQPPAWNFTVSNGGATCLHFESSASSLKLTVGGQTVTERRSGVMGLAVTCPDGTAYASSDAFTLIGCGDGFPPGLTYSSSATSVSFGLIGTEDSFPVFSCRK